jgi:hypothetical protein
VCRSCTADLPASRHPEALEEYKDAMVRSWLDIVACGDR